MRTIAITLIMLLSTICIVAAQQSIFSVLGAKGNIKVGEQKLKIGAKLKEGETIEIGDNSYLSIATTDNRVLEITAKGIYTTQQLLSKVPAKQDLNPAYAKFVINELTKVDVPGVSAKTRFNQMNKTGAVKRGGIVVNYLDFFNSGEEGHRLYGNTVVLMWYVPEVAGKPKLPVDAYEVEIGGIDGTVYFKKKTKENELVIPLSEIKNQGEPDLVCKIRPLDKNGVSLDVTEIDGTTISLYDNSEKSKVTTDLKKFTDGSPVSKLMQAKYFEDKKLYTDAMAAYKEAIKLSDNAEQYENVYYDFLLRYIKM